MSQHLGLSQFFRTQRLLCGSTLFLFMLSALLSMTRPIIIGAMFHSDQKLDGLLYQAQTLALLSAIILFIRTVTLVCYTRIELKILSLLQSTVMQKILQVPLAFFDHYTSGDLVHRILWINSLGPLCSNQGSLFFSFLSLLLSFSIMFYFNWLLTTAVFLFIAVVAGIALWSALRLIPRLEAYAEDQGQAYGFLLQVIHGISRIKLFAREDQILSQWNSLYIAARQRLEKNYRHGAVGYAFFNSLPLLLLLLIFTLTTSKIGELSQQEFVIFFCGLSLLMVSIAAFFINIGGVIDTLIAYRRIQPIVHASREQEQQPSDHTPIQIEQINIQNIHFTYPNTRTTILRGINCRIYRGQHVAFVGLSGSGKSTLLKLLLGFYQPQEGQITVNGQALASLDLIAFRAQLGVALQEGQLINGSIVDNIIGHSAATEEEVVHLLTELGMTSFIQQLPMGIHTMLSQHMGLLSGGQKQMILIAKALLNKPQVLILDEATNAMDQVLQKSIAQRINQLSMTRISIAHRLSTIMQADTIFVLDKGMIVQEGDYQQLIQKKHGLFYQLAQSQGLIKDSSCVAL